MIGPRQLGDSSQPYRYVPIAQRESLDSKGRSFRIAKVIIQELRSGRQCHTPPTFRVIEHSREACVDCRMIAASSG